MKESQVETQKKSDGSWRGFAKATFLFYLLVGLVVWLLSFIPWDKISF